MNRFLIGVLLPIFFFADFCGAAATKQPFAVWHPDHFIVSFWCSPPEPFITVERYKQIADAGFNLVMPICGPTEVERNKKILRCAAANHLKVFLEDKRMPMSLTDQKSRAMIDTIIRDYTGYPSLEGYFLADEPLPPVFAGLAQVSDYLREKDPTHPTFVNLLPGYPGGMMGQAYENYLNYFIDTVHPWVMSYDHYHFTTTGDAPSFLENLDTVARLSKPHDLDFFNIVLATQHLIYRRLTEPEKRYEAMESLAYGARGLLWFTYWQPDNSGMWKDAIINFDGKPTWQYPQITRINRDMSAFGDALLHADWIQTWTQDPPTMTVKFSHPNARFTVGFFKQGATRMLFITSQDYKNPIATELQMQTGGERIERFDLRSKKFVPDKGTHLQLGPAEAALYRWQLQN